MPNQLKELQFFWLTIKALELIGNFLLRILKTQKWIGEGVLKVWVLYKKEYVPSFQWNWYVFTTYLQISFPIQIFLPLWI